MQLFVALFFWVFVFDILHFSFCCNYASKLVLLRLLVLVFLSRVISYLFHFGCIACVVRSVDIIVVIAETRVCQPRHGGSAWVFSHDASGSDCSSKKKNKKKKQEKLLNWPSNKKGGKKL